MGKAGRQIWEMDREGGKRWTHLRLERQTRDAEPQVLLGEIPLAGDDARDGAVEERLRALLANRHRLVEPAERGLQVTFHEE